MGDSCKWGEPFREEEKKSCGTLAPCSELLCVTVFLCFLSAATHPFYPGIFGGRKKPAELA